MALKDCQFKDLNPLLLSFFHFIISFPSLDLEYHLKSHSSCNIYPLVAMCTQSIPYSDVSLPLKQEITIISFVMK